LTGTRGKNSGTVIVVAGLDRVGAGGDKEVIEVMATAFRSDWKSAGSEPLALSGVVLENRQAMVRAGGEAIALLPVVPTTVREFTTPIAQRHFYGFLTARILNDEDRVVFEENSTIPAGSFTTVRSADYRLALPLAGLKTGEYLVSIVAVAGQSSSQRDVRIAIK
jgi:hypothetical protein